MNKEEKQLQKLKSLSIKREQIKTQINALRRDKRDIENKLDDLVQQLVLAK